MHRILDRLLELGLCLLVACALLAVLLDSVDALF